MITFMIYFVQYLYMVTDLKWILCNGYFLLFFLWLQ